MLQQKIVKYNNSLNDCLHIGPSLLPLLFDILLQFRLYPVVILGDIQKAFLQIQVDKIDENSSWRDGQFQKHIVGPTARQSFVLVSKQRQMETICTITCKSDPSRRLRIMAILSNQ